MTNTTLYKNSLRSITLNLFKKAINLSCANGIKQTAPLGYGGETILLFGTDTQGRVNVISLRNHSGSCELLIADSKGKFLFYGKFDRSLGVDFIAEQYYNIYKLVKPFIK